MHRRKVLDGTVRPVSVAVLCPRVQSPRAGVRRGGWGRRPAPGRPQPRSHSASPMNTMGNSGSASPGERPDPMSESSTSNDPYWREAMAPYARPVFARSLLDIFTSVVPFLALWALMYMALRRLLLARPADLDPRRRLPAAHVHPLPRLHARLVLRVAPGQRLGRPDLRPARLPVLRQLAPPPRRPSRLRRRSRSSRDRRRDHLDRRGVLLEALAVPARLPPVPPSGGDVRDRADLVAADRPADLGRLQARQAAQQHPAHQPGGRRDGRAGASSPSAGRRSC